MSFTVARMGDAESGTVCCPEERYQAASGGGDITVEVNGRMRQGLHRGCWHDQSHSGVASTMFEALYQRRTSTLSMISTSEIKISVIIDEEDADKAVAAIHDAFIN